MVTRDDLEQLVKNKGQEAVGAAVVKIPDEDVRPALMLMVMIPPPILSSPHLSVYRGAVEVRRD